MLCIFVQSKSGRKNRSFLLFSYLLGEFQWIITAYDVAKRNTCVLGFVNISTPQQVLCKTVLTPALSRAFLNLAFVRVPPLNLCSGQTSRAGRCFRLIPLEAICFSSKHNKLSLYIAKLLETEQQDMLAAKSQHMHTTFNTHIV